MEAAANMRLKSGCSLNCGSRGFISFCAVLYNESVGNVCHWKLAVLRTDRGLRERNSDPVETETTTGQRREVHLRFLTARCLLPGIQKHCS